MATQDLWGDLPLEENIRTPVTVLREQAALLGEKTRQVLQGDVRVHHSIGLKDFEAEFFITAPALDDYSYRLFSIQYPVTMYPLRISESITGMPPIEYPSEESFVNALRIILSHPEVKKIISSLVAQSKANN